jgi:hypothetical protein
LLHSYRADCETYLQKALSLDPDLAMANASLGMLRVRQGKSDEARKSLERAVTASSQNYLIHYYYAYALSREGNRDMETVMGFAPETATIMRSELKRAIELRPDFPESYSLLAFVNLVTNNELDETIQLLMGALAGSPGSNELVFMLAQLQMRKEDFKAARQLIDKLTSGNDEALRRRGQGLLSQLVSIEEQLAHIQAMRNGRTGSGNSPILRESSAANGQADALETFDPATTLRDSLRKPAAGETQAQGILARIDCDAKGITFLVRINERVLKLRTDSFARVDLMSFSPDAGGEVTCGLRKPENNVIVAYVPATETHAKVDGVIRSVEFVPPDFKLKASQ